MLKRYVSEISFYFHPQEIKNISTSYFVPKGRIFYRSTLSISKIEKRVLWRNFTHDSVGNVNLTISTKLNVLFDMKFDRTFLLFHSDLRFVL